MEQTIALPASEAKQARVPAEVAFEQLYLSSWDDVYAYAAGLLRDRSAAEEVTAIGQEVTDADGAGMSGVERLADLDLAMRRFSGKAYGRDAGAIKDADLASDARRVEKQTDLSAAESRKVVREAIEQRYTLPAG